MVRKIIYKITFIGRSYKIEDLVNETISNTKECVRIEKESDIEYQGEIYHDWTTFQFKCYTNLF